MNAIKTTLAMALVAATTSTMAATAVEQKPATVVEAVKAVMYK